MNKIFTLCTAFALTGTTAFAQPMLSNGFGFMAAINGTTYQKTANVGSGSYQFIAASNDGQYFYAANFNKSTIYIINSSTYAFVDSFTGPTAYYMTGYSEPNMIFCRGNKSLLRYNPAAKSLTDSLLIGNPWYVEERPGAKEVWVAGDSLIYVVNYSSSLSLTGTIKTSNNQNDYGDVRFTPKGSIAYKGATSRKKVYKIDANTRTIIDSIDTAPYGFDAVLVSADSSKLYACNYSTKIYTIDAATKGIVDSSMTSNKQIMRLYRHPSRAEIWAVHHFSDSVTVYNESTKAAIASFGIGPSPYFLAFATGNVGVNKLTNGYDMQLYPNPVQNELIISMPRNDRHTVELTDVTGRQLNSITTTENIHMMNVASLPAGQYYITVFENGQRMKTTAFVKE